MNWTAVLEWCRQKIVDDIDTMSEDDVSQVVLVSRIARMMLRAS